MPICPSAMRSFAPSMFSYDNAVRGSTTPPAIAAAEFSRNARRFICEEDLFIISSGLDTCPLRNVFLSVLRDSLSSFAVKSFAVAEPGRGLRPSADRRAHPAWYSLVRQYRHR